MNPSPKTENQGLSRIIAVDPGINITGYGILEGDRSTVRVIACGVIKNSARMESPAKLAVIYGRISDLLEEYLPTACVLEDVFYHKNVRATLKLGQVRGVCALAAAQRELPVVSYATRRVKKAVVGTGSARKEQVCSMVQALLRLDKPPSPMDISDALALGITYFQDFSRHLEEK